MDIPTVHIVRMLLATGCGLAIGAERGSHLKQAGIRTHMIVALGAALMTIISKYGFTDLSASMMDGLLKVDASRIMSQIVTGISFLGAGLIIMHDRTVTGLTTAAGVWTTAGIGMAIGAGLYWEGIFATALVLIIQLLFHSGSPLTTRNVPCDLSLQVIDDQRYLTNIFKYLSSLEVEVQSVNLSRADSMVQLSVTLGLKTPEEIPPLAEHLQAMDGVTGVKL